MPPIVPVASGSVVVVQACPWLREAAQRELRSYVEMRTAQPTWR
jgi:hypothetical protein